MSRKYSGRSRPNVKDLRLDLGYGLSKLASLKDLEELLFKGAEQDMEREDFQWILDQWPKLKELTADFNTSKCKNRELRSMVTEMQGINMVGDADDSDGSSGDEDEDEVEEELRPGYWRKLFDEEEENEEEDDEEGYF